MNLFCFTLEGSTESIYEPAYSQTFKEVLPKYQCSPEWGGSDPSINADHLQKSSKLSSKNRRSRVLTAVETESLAPRQSCVLRGETKVKELSSERTDPPAQCDETTGETRDPTQTTGRLKKLQKLVHLRTGHQNNNCLAEVVRNNSPVLTCVGLGGRTERSSSVNPASPQQLLRHNNTLPEDDGAWSPKTGGHMWEPVERPQASPLFHHTCQRTPHEPWTCSGSLSLPRSSEWERFESLSRELDGKGSDLCLPPMIRSITDLHLRQNAQKQEPLESRLDRKETESSLKSDQKAPPEETLTTLTSDDTQNDEAERREDGSQEVLRKSRNSLESLYSLHSGQSSSSGVTSGSDCSSNRGSLRLEEDLSSTKQFCCRARVHTEYVPSPYDSESLRLKVGDVIEVTAKPPMGTWTGTLNGRSGYFKFIYVDVLPEKSSEATAPEARRKSTIQEVLQRLSLEEYSSSLQLSGYQTVGDLMRLREGDLTAPKVTDPEHRRRLLAAAHALQQLHTDSHLYSDASWEPEKSDLKDRPRDSGCILTSEEPDSCTEDSALAPSELPVQRT